MLLFYRDTQRLPYSNKVLLSDHLVEFRWTYPCGKRFHLDMVLLSLLLCGLVNDVRTRYVNRDPELLKLIASIKATEKLVPEYLKKAA